MNVFMLKEYLSTYNAHVPQGTQIHFLLVNSPEGPASAAYMVRMK